MTRPLGRVLETVLYVDDLDEAARFYGEVLGLKLFSRKAGLFCFFRLDEAMLLLFDPKAAAVAGREVPSHGAHGPGHCCLAVADEDLDGWRARLEAAGVAIEQTYRWPRGGRSLYFRDPAGNSLEFASPAIWGFPDPSAG